MDAPDFFPAPERPGRILDDESGWQFKSHTLQPVFMGHEAPPSIAIDTHRVGHRIPTAAATAP